MNTLKQRYRYSFILLKQLVKTDFKLRYQGSFLGYAWSLLRPLFMFAILYFVFTILLPVNKGIPHFPVYLLTGIVLWNYFLETTTGSVGAIVGKGEILRKINFPRYVIILAVSVSGLINLLLNGVVIFIFMILTHVSIGWQSFMVVPLIFELLLISLSLAFALSALFIKFRDVSYIWDVVMQAAFYLTPILYPIQRAPVNIQKILILNPLAQIIQDFRHVLVTPYASTIEQIYGGNFLMRATPIMITLTILVVSSLYFRKRSKYFAEEV